MGILARPIEMMRSLPLPPGFSVCELGDQYVTAEEPKYLAQELYERWGCSRYVSLDGNGRGTVVCDLNRKLPRWLTINKFDLVTDFGTGEHVFNQHQIWKTLHDLCKVGGFIAFDRPATGFPEHCFYLVNECLIRDIASANEYEVIYLEKGQKERGELWRGVFYKKVKNKFLVPQQGRYAKSLRKGMGAL